LALAAMIEHGGPAGLLAKLDKLEYYWKRQLFNRAKRWLRERKQQIEQENRRIEKIMP
jgi:hypothetical protein